MKYIKYIILLFVIFTVSFVLLDKKEDVLSVVTVKHNYSQNIKDNEVVRIPLLISLDGTYISDVTKIKSLSLFNDKITLSVGLDGIYKQDYTINYKNKDYYAYMIDILINQEEVNLEMSNSSLSIVYENDYNLEFEIGDVSLVSGEVKDFDITMLDSRSAYLDNYYTVSNVIVGIKPKKDIILKSVSLTSDKYYLDNKNILVTNTIPEFVESEEIFYYNSIEKDENNIKLDENEQYYLTIPVHYVDKSYLFRFFIKVETDENTNLIDDFLYLNQGYFPSFIFDDAKEIIIHDQFL